MIQRCLLHGLLVLFAGFYSNPAAATQADLLIRLGDSAYFRRAYDSAEYYYSGAAAANNKDAVALYKLGNAHFRLRHTGEAVLAYERALKRRPGFADAAENLAIIQRRLQPDAQHDEVFFVHWWRAVSKPSLSNMWAVLGIVCFCFPLGILAWSRVTRKRVFWLRPQLIGGGVILGILFATLATVSIHHASDSVAVVMKQDATLNLEYKGKSAGKTGLVALPEGLVVKVLHKESSSLLVSLPDGREGLMQSTDIALVE